MDLAPYICPAVALVMCSLGISTLYCHDVTSLCYVATTVHPSLRFNTNRSLTLRQVARSLQGKTRSDKASTVMTDEDHDTKKYMEFICAHASNVERSVFLAPCISDLDSFHSGLETSIIV